jgi:hypothetical protein
MLLTDNSQNIQGQWDAYDPPDRGIPGRIEGGGTRGPCPVNPSDRLTALSPETNAALTVSAYPTFFVYVPENYTQKQVNFNLAVYVDGNTKEVYKTNFTTPANPGIVSFSLPKDLNLPALEIGQNYYWSFTLLCNPQKPDQDRIVDGWIKRVTNSQANTDLPRDRLIAYTKEAIWQDTLSTLADLHRTNPNDPQLTDQWTSLLKSVGLTEIANKPFVECCTVKQAQN